MNFELLPQEDKKTYLFFSLALLFVGLAVFWFLPHGKAFGISGLLAALAGAYWIAAGVALGKTDLANLERASISGGAKYFGVDPNKKAITDLFLLQSKRVKFGICFIAVGTLLQIIAVYIGS